MAECFNIYIEDISCNGKGQIENLALLHILKGDTGDTGLSAYELALQIGFIGTLEEWIASLKGEKGEQGDTGNGIDKIELTNTSENGLEKTYRITFTDKTTFDYIVKDGNGIVDIIFVSVSEDGLQKTYQINFQDSTSFQFIINQGVGIKTIEKTSTLGLVDTYTITFADDITTTFDVTNGAKGDKGDNSFSPYIDPNTLTWWVYNDTTKQYEDTGISVNDFIKKDGSIPLNAGYIPTTPLGIATKDYVDKQVTLYNITNEIPLPAGNYYTLATAIAAIPTNIKKLSLKLTFQVSATNSETWEFFNDSIANFSNVAYWRKTINNIELFSSPDLLPLNYHSGYGIKGVRTSINNAQVDCKSFRIICPHIDIANNYVLFGVNNLFRVIYGIDYVGNGNYFEVLENGNYLGLSTYGINSATPIEDVIITINANNTASLFRNGILITTTSANNVLSIIIGANCVMDMRFSAIYQVQGFTSALTSTDALLLYNNGNPFSYKLEGTLKTACNFELLPENMYTNKVYDSINNIWLNLSTPATVVVNNPQPKQEINGTSAPSIVPDMIGQLFNDLTNKKTYKAYGNSAVNDWVLLN